jgi:2,3,4,5-tetrahydropyridine-2-carboxylate N-succinyltransferase
MIVENITEFKKVVEEIEKDKDYQQPLAFGIGIGTIGSDGSLLDTYFPAPNFLANFGTAAILAKVLGYKNGTHFCKVSQAQLSEILYYFTPFENDGKKHENINVLKNIQKIVKTLESNRKVVVASFIGSGENDSGPKEVPDAYLRLHLLSHRLVKPHGINLANIFKILPNVVWTSEGPVALEDLTNSKMMALASNRTLTVNSVDKFPRMVDYVVPTGVRIADASRVRLGAYLGEGTTVMHEGFVNFNAGCEGPNMIEGRISAGVFVKKGSDLGGGCSTMGTLSGGGNVVISIGENCLLGANSGLGIPLGDRCTIEAGLYITAGTKVLCDGKVIKAKELSGKDDMLFRRNSQTGQVEAISKANAVELNTILHSN